MSAGDMFRWLNSATRRGRLALFLAASALLVLAPSAAADYGAIPGSIDLRFEESDGSAAIQAGSHPYALTASIQFNRTAGNQPDGNTKEVLTELPPGFVGDTTAYPRCALADFLVVTPEFEGSKCPDSTALGVVYNDLETSVDTPSPVFNLPPPPGVALRFGFVVLSMAYVIADVTVKQEPDYNVVTRISGIPQTVGYFGTPRLTLWGNPSDPSHDAERGKCAKAEDPSARCPTQAVSRPFLTLPTRCAGPQQSRMAIASWQQPDTFIEYLLTTHDSSVPPQPQGIVGCEKLPFSPTTQVRPTTNRGVSGSGLDFVLDVNQEGLTSVSGLAQSTIEKTVVSLPEGVSINPSQAEGLGTCSEADLARETASSEPGAGCPNESKIGTAEVHSPLLGDVVDGAIYVATPYENPEHSLIALYLVLQERNSGLSVHIPIRIDTDPVSGQVTAVAEDLPQLPFGQFKLHFREGTRSPLVTPPACGTHVTTAMLYPWAGGEPVESRSSFEINGGPESGPCPTGGAQPFSPSLSAGTRNNAAGSFSPFDVRISRRDSEQEITNFSIKLPPGVAGKLAGIPSCSEAAIALARSRTGPHGGQEELDSPSCPAASQLGVSLAGSGVGPLLAYAPGKVYLGGPFNGHPLSLVAVTAGVVGPFDIGTVVIRFAIDVNRSTAEVFLDPTGSDPIPHIIKGIILHVRDIRSSVDRPQFTFNPTNCTPTSTASTVLGAGLDFASPVDDNPFVATSRFQAADCAALDFKPFLRLKLLGGNKRGKNPRLRATLTMPPGNANIDKAQVALPASAFLDQSHIGTVCTRVQYAAEACPPRSVYGYARAFTPLLDEPLEGPVYLRSSSNKLPDLVAKLAGRQITIDLVGRIDSFGEGRIRTTFEGVPDAPVSKFVLNMRGGKKGLIQNSRHLCRRPGRNRAVVNFDAQSGKSRDFRPVVRARCKRSKRAKSSAHHSSSAAAARISAQRAAR